MGKYVGIDLGTTFSAVSYIDDKGNPQIIPNKNGSNTTPSTVLFEDGKTVVGMGAKKKSSTKPNCYEAFVKRHMGERNYTFTAPDGTAYRPEDISAIILRKLKEDAEAYLGEEILGAVITVPAYFGDPQRVATEDAARIAGINVLETINEPTAAAIAFGVSKDIDKMQRVAVYDFGGGTFDVSVLEFDNDNITVLSTNGDHQLGGYDLDLEIYKLAVESALEDGVDIESDPKAKQKLMLEIEEAKKTLSVSDEAEICIYVKGEEYCCEIDRETFEEAIEDKLETTLSIMQGALNEAKLSYSDIDKILLVGGSTRIPAVSRIIEANTGIIPSSEVHPDEAVAIGAAFHAIEVAKRNNATDKSSGTANASGGAPTENVVLPELDKSYTFKDVMSHGIGVVVCDMSGNLVNAVLMPKNTEIPAEIINDDFGTVQPFQQEVAIRVTQGEFTELEYVTIIGEAVLSIRPRDKIVPIRFIVSCDESQVIHVRAVDMDDNVDLGEITINREGHNMTEEQVKKSADNIHRLNIS